MRVSGSPFDQSVLTLPRLLCGLAGEFLRPSPALADADALLEFKPCAAAAPLWDFFLGRPVRLRNTRTWPVILVWLVVGMARVGGYKWDDWKKSA